VSLLVKHGEPDYKVNVRYLDIEEIQDLVALEVSEGMDSVDLLGAQGPPELNPAQIDWLGGLLCDPSDALGDPIAIEALRPELRTLVESGTQGREFSPEQPNELLGYLLSHVDSSGIYWKITKEVEVAGPFPGLPPGILIMDLPGFGDMDDLRVSKARSAMRHADQVLVVTDQRGVGRDVYAALVEVGLVESVLLSPNIQQVIFAGTHIDYGRVSPHDQVKLGLKDDYSSAEAVKAQFGQWAGAVRDNWERILNTEIAKAPGVAHRDISTVLSKTTFIPTSPEGYLCLVGLQRDPTETYRRAFGKVIGKRAGEATGIGAVRRSLSELVRTRQQLRLGGATRRDTWLGHRLHVKVWRSDAC
jgi:hypothetical protein